MALTEDEAQLRVDVGHGLDPPLVASYLGMVMGESVIAPSALKHGVEEDDILHAYWNPLRIWDLGDGFTMIVGPNRAALFLEVGYVDGEQTYVIVHAMVARVKFLR
ncbi:hypothetical protein [Propioniciclava soli]|uniref:hypothetical protein n=1 Tax=Propioniciclava soli TaxID=2775081 RepID=UPI001E2F0D26|nr:hypothetical protein [Propioniciclava soli]